MIKIMLSTIFATLAVVRAASAEGDCATELYGYKDLIISSRSNGSDDSKRLVVPDYDCNIARDIDHGLNSFGCGEKLWGYWGYNNVGSVASGFGSLFADSAIKLPKHTKLRKSWLAPIDEEGVHQGYPIDDKTYEDFYPRRFASTKNMFVYNSNMQSNVQSYNYVAMNGKQRVAVAGAVTVRCLVIHFYTWAAPHRANAIEQDMVRFIGNLRLDPIK